MGYTHRIKSFETFTDQLAERNPDEIAIRPLLHARSGILGIVGGVSSSPTIGYVGNWKYGLKYEVRSNEGRRSRDYAHVLFTAFGSERGEADEVARRKNVMRILLAGEAASITLAATLPETDVRLMIGDEVASPDKLRILHEDAAHYGVPLPEVVAEHIRANEPPPQPSIGLRAFVRWLFSPRLS